jgi:dolichol-phosphate mannosyltransferase
VGTPFVATGGIAVSSPETDEPPLPGSVLVIVPTYDEVRSLEGVVRRVRAAVPPAHVLVVDDNSPDGTGVVADRLAAQDSQVAVLHRPGKEGLAAAYLAGFRWGSDHGFDTLVQMDADGSHQPEELPRLLAPLRYADMVLGSRWVPGGEARNWPWSRRFVSRGGTIFARRMLGLGISDTTGGYHALRTSALAVLDLGEMTSHGYCFQIDLIRRAVNGGLRVVEVPITFVEREHGYSKMSAGVVGEAFWRVTAWGIERRRAGWARRRKQRSKLWRGLIRDSVSVRDGRP